MSGKSPADPPLLSPPVDSGVRSDKKARRGSSPFASVRASWRSRFAGRVAMVLVVSAGGVVGGCARYGVEVLVPADAAGFPWPTFAVNVTGAFWLALLLVLILEVWPPTRYVRPFLAVGLLGSLTTFSTWMVEVDQLLTNGAPTVAAAYLVASLGSGVAATSLGLLIGRGVATRRTRNSTKGRT